jgi:hypothetical protein
LLFEAMQGWIQRPALDVEEFVGSCANCDADSMAVLSPPLQRAEDHHVERSLQQTDGP